MPGHITQTVLKYDEALQKADSNNYKLSIQLSLDWFSFCIFNEAQNKFLSIESIALQNVKNLNNFCILFESFFQKQSVLVSIVHPFELLPDFFFRQHNSVASFTGFQF